MLSRAKTCIIHAWRILSVSPYLISLSLASIYARASPAVALPFSRFSSRRRAATSGLANYTKVPTFSLSPLEPWPLFPGDLRGLGHHDPAASSSGAGDAHYLACSGRPATTAAAAAVLVNAMSVF